jgi:hypothetical protein
VDKFDKNALIACAILATLIVTFSFIATNLLGQKDLPGTDGVVEEQAATVGTKTPTHVVSLDETGEYIGFTMIGLAGGFAAGYWYVDAFYERGKADG